ncbi:LPD25 domain-containing protein [Vibrio lentus]|uniref:LPD25 domain-containing protein n=1 Tax=Vibrio lentus TaxID=136468 RepID=UPI003D0CE43F
MSHSLSLHTHSTKPAKASNVSPLHPSGSTTMKVAPLSVLIHWSESSRLQTDEEFEFEIFEAIALKAALDNPLGGYDKTEVTVKFEGVHQHRCRIDLGCGGNETGFADHCFRILEYSESLKKSEPNHWYLTNSQGKELVELLKSYQLSRQQVANARQATFEKVRLAKEAEKQIEVEQRKAAQALRSQEEKEFRESLNIPEWAQSVIVARFTEYDEENSQPYGDYYQFKTTRTIILAWSKHQRRIFPELRKACLNHKATAFLNVREQSEEHRENYSMGKGVYLTNQGYVNCGWEVKKVCFWGHSDKAQYVPVGELAL